MAKYRKKPIVIEAEQWYPKGGVKNYAPSKDLAWQGQVYKDKASKTGYSIDTLEGSHEVTPGDWIIVGIKGETYPCKPDIFAATYELVPDGKITESALQDQIDAVTNEEIRAKRSHLPTREDKRGARRLG